jgi:hypothetical protein
MNPSAITVISVSIVPVAVIVGCNNNFAGAPEEEWHKNFGAIDCEVNQNNLRLRAGSHDDGTERSHTVSCSYGPVPVAVLNAFRSTHPNDLVYKCKLSSGNWKAHFMRGNVK